MSEDLLDCLGRRRSPAARSAFHTGRPPANRGLHYPADPPPVEELIGVMRAAGTGAYARSAASHDRRPVAGRLANRRGARPGRDRPGPRPRCDHNSAGQGR